MALKELLHRILGRQPRPGSADGPRAGDVLSRHAERLMRSPGVMSVGVGQTPDGRAAIVVGTDRLSAEAEAALPESLEGVPVVRHVIGRPEALRD